MLDAGGVRMERRDASRHPVCSSACQSSQWLPVMHGAFAHSPSVLCAGCRCSQPVTLSTSFPRCPVCHILFNSRSTFSQIKKWMGYQESIQHFSLPLFVLFSRFSSLSPESVNFSSFKKETSITPSFNPERRGWQCAECVNPFHD